MKYLLYYKMLQFFYITFVGRWLNQAVKYMSYIKLLHIPSFQSMAEERELQESR